jgi:hypothetical protein
VTSEYSPTDDRVVVGGRAILDLRHFTSAQQLASIGRIEGVALVIVPESLAAAYTAIPTDGVAATVYVPDGANVRAHVGQLEVGGDGIGAPDELLVVCGMLIVTSPVTGPVPHRIHVVGSVLAPRGSEAALGPAIAGTGTANYYPHVDGQSFKAISGQARISGAMLANPVGRPEDVLIVAGQAVVTGEIAAVGYRQVLVAGQLVAPSASRDVLEPRIDLHGQVAWHRGDEPYTFYGEATLGPDFFRLLDARVALVVFGELVIGAGVTEAMMRDKVTGISVFGDVVVPPELLGVTQLLATDTFGTIRAGDGPGS